MVAADCGQTSFDTGTPCGLAGTSQSAAHLTGLAALVLDRYPHFSIDQLVYYLRGNTPDRSIFNNTWGEGFVLLPPGRDEVYVNQLPTTYTLGQPVQITLQNPYGKALEAKFGRGSDPNAPSLYFASSCSGSPLSYKNVTSTQVVDVIACGEIVGSSELILAVGNSVRKLYNVHSTRPATQCDYNVGTLSTTAITYRHLWTNSCKSSGNTTNNSNYYEFVVSSGAHQVEIEIDPIEHVNPVMEIKQGSKGGPRVEFVNDGGDGVTETFGASLTSGTYWVEALVLGTNTVSTYDIEFKIIEATEGAAPPNNLILSESADDDEELTLDYTDSTSIYDYYVFELYFREGPDRDFILDETENDNNPPETFDVSRGNYYRARGKTCTDSARTDCGSWSPYSNIVELSDPTIEITGLDASLEVGDNDSFTVALTDLSYDETYTVALNTSDGSIGFTSSCQKTTSQSFNALLRDAENPSQPRYRNLTFRLYACGAPGGTLTVQVRKGSITGRLEDTATVTITVTETLLPSAPAPGNIHQDSSTPTQIEVDWDQVSHTTMYQLEYKVATSNSWRTASSSITTSSYTLTNLACGTDYHVRVTAYGDGITYDEDWGATSAETRLATSICPNPVFINEPYAFEIRETATIGTLVGTVQANDPNGDTVTYHVVPASPGDFAVNSATGNITVNAALDYDSRSSYRITVEARDPTGYTDTTTVSITVLENIPPAPSNLRATSTSKTAAEIAWDPLPNTTSYWLQYRLAGHTNWITASNAISGNTQQVPNLVCEATYQFQVRAFGDGLTYSDRWGVITQPLTVVMPDCGEPVFGSTSYTFQVTQGSTVGTEVGILDASDPDGETITFSVTADQSGGRFVVDQHTGMITVNIVPTSIRNYAMTLQASDGAYSSSVPVEIQVVANRSPVIDSLTYDFSVRDDAALGTSVGYVSATDPENDPITYSFFAGHIEEDFNINAGTGEITVADPLNAVAIDEYVFLVQAFDGTSNAFTSVAVDVIDSAPCDGGTAVPDPGNNVALVADCQIMRGLQDDLAGDGTLNWSGRLAMTSWDGVTIAGTPSRVTEINLGSRSLQGVVPAGLGSLSALEVLDLNFNLLTGEIPAELGNLSSLTRLSLHVNALSGEMPTELGNLANLQELDLNFNYLNGPIPTQLGQLTELTLLNLSTNRLTGPVPTELGSLTNLVTLWLYDNRLTGSVPASLTALTSLQALHIADNRFTGCLPAALRSITFNDLAQLNLPDCQN